METLELKNLIEKSILLNNNQRNYILNNFLLFSSSKKQKILNFLQEEKNILSQISPDLLKQISQKLKKEKLKIIEKKDNEKKDVKKLLLELNNL